MDDVLVVGAGPMASAYIRVLRALGIDPVVVGRSESSASRLRSKLHIRVQTGGLSKFLDHAPAPERAILALPVEELAASAKLLALAGTKNILIEKPGALNTDELSELIAALSVTHTKAWVAYNRRFLESTQTARRLILQDGGVTSFRFDFSERVDDVKQSPASSRVKEAWVVANSSHVIDLAFYLCGMPKEIASWTGGRLSWHKSGDRFVGAGIAASGAPFSYRSDWSSPGRWSLEIGTAHRRLLLSPLETLQQMLHGSWQFEVVNTENSDEEAFKPGLFKQTQAFVENETSELCSVPEQQIRMSLYERIAGYRAAPGPT